MSELSIGPFAARDQDAVQALILDGLREHWGQLDPSLNPDLDDLARSYREGTVLVAWRDGGIVGAGAVVPTEAGEGEVKRLGVARAHRRTGVACALLRALVAVAVDEGWTALVLETSANWADAVALYLAFGFTLTHHEEGAFGRDAWFRLEVERD